jgi:hypothetical protein
MAFDTFISYSSKDKTTANMACAALESAGVRCWIAPRDILPGTEYAAGIVDGIDSCRILVLIFSSNANASPQIHRELERAISKGLTVIPFRIEDIAPSKAMEYYIGSIHWLDALTPPLAQHLGHLTEQVKANLNVDAPNSEGPAGAFEKTAPQKASFVGGDYGRSSRPPSQSIMRQAGQLALVAAVGVLAAAVFLLGHFLPLTPSVPDHPAGAGPAAPPMTVPEPSPQPAPVPSPAFAIRKSAAFGGNGGSAFDETDSNANHLQVTAVSVGVNLNPADTSQRIVGSLQVQWGDKIGPLHGGKGPLAQPGTTARFDSGEKIGRVDINSKAYHFPTSNAPPQWIAGLEIWTDTRAYTLGDMTFGPTNQCILDYGEILLGFFGRSGSYIDQIGCIIGKAK